MQRRSSSSVQFAKRSHKIDKTLLFIKGFIQAKNLMNVNIAIRGSLLQETKPNMREDIWKISKNIFNFYNNFEDIIHKSYNLYRPYKCTFCEKKYYRKC